MNSHSCHSFINVTRGWQFFRRVRKMYSNMCMILCNNILDKLSIIYNNYIVRPRLLHPLPALCGTSRPVLYLIFSNQTRCIWYVYRYVLYEYVIVTCTSTSFEIVMMGPSLVPRWPDPVDPRGRLKNNDIADFSILVSLNERPWPRVVFFLSN